MEFLNGALITSLKNCLAKLKACNSQIFAKFSSQTDAINVWQF